MTCMRSFSNHGNTWWFLESTRVAKLAFFLLLKMTNLIPKGLQFSAFPPSRVGGFDGNMSFDYLTAP